MTKRFLIVAAAIAVAILPGNSASAVPAGLQIVTVASANNVGDKTIFVPCPQGKVVTGGGGYLAANVAALGLVGIDQLEPHINGFGFTTTMRTAGNPPNWQMVARAVCTNPIPGWQRVQATAMPQAGGAWATVTTAPCPTGKSVIGVGARVNGGEGFVYLDDVVPAGNQKQVTATAYRLPGSSWINWSLTAFAICANTPAGLHIVTWDYGPADGNDHKSVSMFCPAGEGIYSTGFELFGSNGSALMTGVNNYALDKSSVWAHEYGGAPIWRLRIYLICGS